MSALHRIQWIDAEIRADAYPNARRVADRFEISHRQGQRDFEYLRDSLGAPLAYSALRRGYRYEGEAYVLPGQFVTSRQRGVLGSLAQYYARSAQRRHDPVMRDVATLFARLSGPAPRPSRTEQNGTPEAAPGLPFLATLSVPGRHFMLDMERLGVPIPEGLAPFHRGGEGPQRVLFEFRPEETEQFVAALLGAWPPFRVEHPAWLRERVLLRLDRLRVANNAPAERAPGD